MIANHTLANPYPERTRAHSYFHLWRSYARQAAQAREAAAHFDGHASFYLNQLHEISVEGRSNVEIEATAVEVDHV